MARPDDQGGWELTVVRYGRFAAAARARRGVDPMPVVEAMVASAETVLPGTGPLFAASAEETGTLLRWIERPGSRLVRSTAPWSSPAAGGGALAAVHAHRRYCAQHPTGTGGAGDADRGVIASRHGDGDRAHRYRGGPDPGGGAGRSPTCRVSIRSYSCAGDVDVVAVVRAVSHEAIAELVPGQISKVSGVVRSDHPHRVPRVFEPGRRLAFSIGMQA